MLKSVLSHLEETPLSNKIFSPKANVCVCVCVCVCALKKRKYVNHATSTGKTQYGNFNSQVLNTENTHTHTFTLYRDIIDFFLIILAY